MGLTFGDLDVLGAAALAKQSKQLDELAASDYSSIDRELTRAFKNTKNMPRRYVPLVPRYVDELSGFYGSTVVRKFGPDQPAESWQKLVDIYSNSKVNQALAEVEQTLWVQNGVVIIPIPDGPRQVKLVIARPWECEVLVDEPLHAHEPRGWAMLRVRMPISVTNGSAVYGWMELTRTTAWREVGGSRVGLFAVDGSNPLGRIPAVVIHRANPPKGHIFGPVNQALLSLAIALCLRESDLELLVHTQGWGQKVITGSDPSVKTKEIDAGPEKVMFIYATGDDRGTGTADMKIVQGNPPIAQIVGHMESSMRTWCSLLGLSPDAFLRVNTSLTAASKLFSEQARNEVRSRIKPRLASAEQELAATIADVTNATGLLTIDASAVTVSVSWVSPELPVDPLHDAQSDAANVALGTDRRSAIIARKKAISQAEAEKELDANIAESNRIGLPLAPANGTVAGVPMAPPIDHAAGGGVP